MSKTFPESSRLIWLTTALANRRSRISDLLRRLAGFGSRQDMAPDVDNKFMGLIGQVADAQEEEEHLISRIEEIEMKHRLHRSRNQLERADPNYDPVSDCEDEAYANKGSLFGPWWFLAMWFGMNDSSASQKKQGPNND
jgi:hypothetical protein